MERPAHHPEAGSRGQCVKRKEEVAGGDAAGPEGPGVKMEEEEGSGWSLRSVVS